MDKVLGFIGEHPIVSIIIGSMLLGSIVKLVPWSRRGDS